jgi:VWFA-related protein
MFRYLAAGTLAACILGLGAAAAQQPVFRGVGDAVRVFVTVIDRDGRLVTDLTRDDFEVRDDGKPQPVTLFDNSPQPIRLIVMLDVSGSMQGNLALLRASSEELFARLGPDDLVRIGTFGHDVEISPTFTRDREELRAALPDRIAPDAPTPLWRAIDEALDAFGEVGDVRRVVLVLSDGKDSGPISFRRRYISQAEVIDRARTADVMVYAIGMRSRGPAGSSSAPLRRRQPRSPSCRGTCSGARASSRRATRSTWRSSAPAARAARTRARAVQGADAR